MTPLAPLEAYRLLASEYDRAPNPVVALERRTLMELLPELRGRLVVDAAAGTGYWASWCNDRGARAIAVDFCWEMLHRLGCPLPLGSGHVPAICGDLRALPIPDGVADVTICAFGVGYAPGCMSELRRVTRPGGSVIVSDVHPDAIGRGWTRSFRHQRQTIEVGHSRYALEDLTVPGLSPAELREPCFGEPERGIFESAGKAFPRDRAPAIFVARWTAV